MSGVAKWVRNEHGGRGTNRDSLVTDSRNWINRLIVLAEISAPSALVQLLSPSVHTGPPLLNSAANKGRPGDRNNPNYAFHWSCKFAVTPCTNHPSSWLREHHVFSILSLSLTRFVPVGNRRGKFFLCLLFNTFVARASSGKTRNPQQIFPTLVVTLLPAHYFSTISFDGTRHVFSPVRHEDGV